MNEEEIKNIQMEESHFFFLIGSYMSKTISETEHDELDSYIANEEYLLLFEKLIAQTNYEALLSGITRSQERLTKKVLKQIVFDKEFRHPFMDHFKS